MSTATCERCKADTDAHLVVWVGDMRLCRPCWKKRRCDECGKASWGNNSDWWNQDAVGRGVICWRCL